LTINEEVQADSNLSFLVVVTLLIGLYVSVIFGGFSIIRAGLYR